MERKSWEAGSRGASAASCTCLSAPCPGGPWWSSAKGQQGGEGKEEKLSEGPNVIPLRISPAARPPGL